MDLLCSSVASGQLRLFFCRRFLLLVVCSSNHLSDRLLIVTVEKSTPCELNMGRHKKRLADPPLCQACKIASPVDKAGWNARLAIQTRPIVHTRSFFCQHSFSHCFGMYNLFDWSGHVPYLSLLST